MKVCKMTFAEDVGRYLTHKLDKELTAMAGGSSGGCGKPGHVTAGSEEGAQWCATCAIEAKRPVRAREWLRGTDNAEFLTGVVGASGNLLCRMLEDFAAHQTAALSAEVEAVHDDYKDLGSHIIPDGKDQSTIHLIGGQNVTIGHDVEMLVQTLENDLGVGERAVHKAA